MPRRTEVLAVLCLMMACSEEDRLHPSVCSEPCFTSPTGAAGVGPCRAGEPVCDDAEQLIDCIGQVLPSPDLCDGVDNDCNGVIDDDMAAISAAEPSLGQVCGQADGPCGLGTIRCIGGRVSCDAVDVIQDEICDGRDNDCDGVVDNIPLEPDFCFDGPVEALVHPPCHPGVHQCEAGRWGCVNQQVPRREVCGDGIDQNCNGLVDDGLATDAEIDVVLIVDRSGSMALGWPEVVRQLIEVTNLLAAVNDVFHFWLFELPVYVLQNQSNRAWPNSVCHPGPVWPLEPCRKEDLEAALDSIEITSGTSEPTYDAIWDVATGFAPLQWRTHAERWIVLVTDEPGSSVYGRSEALLSATLAGLWPPLNLLIATSEEGESSFDELPMGRGGLVRIGSELGEGVLRLVPPCE